MKIEFTIALIALLSMCYLPHAYSQSSPFSYEQYSNKKGDTLNYRLLVSDYAPGVKYPLVIFLHGSGEAGNDNDSQLKWGVQNFASDLNMKMYPSIVIAPQCPYNIDWVNFSEDNPSLQPSPTKPLELVIELIDEFIKNSPVDENRIYITGLSSGAFGTFDAIMRYPKLFAAAVPVCGSGDPSKASTIAHIPIWIFQGALDEVVDPKYSHNMLEALTNSGAHPGYTQYPEVGHFAWLAAYTDPMMMEWLFRQRKKR